MGVKPLVGFLVMENHVSLVTLMPFFFMCMNCTEFNCIHLSGFPQFLPFCSSWQSMSAGGAFGGNRGIAPVPPEKGIFPLDRLHQCDLEKKEYLSCLKSSGYQSETCRFLSKKYLECRMQRNLMAKQDLKELGFVREQNAEASEKEIEVTNASGNTLP
ncbi:hypothetical protein Syun_006063 [Stephania yunnanensis]|uniref:CHCH domain-containing protein n=1 Tax=Stephania yunnanensis TaxID=152371 RepID=A0AAP0KXL1_9MAGN